MPFEMEFEVDGGCRNNGRKTAYGAAVAVQTYKNGQTDHWWSEKLSGSTPRPTNQRAELLAILIALRQASSQFRRMRGQSTLDLTIYSDSRYAIGCMNQWIHKWRLNGWKNQRGEDVANRDLIEKASKLDIKVKALGTVTYEFVPRAYNFLADHRCNQVMDEV